MRFKGVYTAIITPFTLEGQLDEEGFSKLLDEQVNAKVAGVVILGTTGEAPTLNLDEKKRLIKLSKEKIKAPMQLIIGTGSNATDETIEETLFAEKMGADAALIVCPYYNKPTQEGIFLHYQAIAKASSLPQIVYNVAVRTGVNISTETLKRLTEIPSIYGVKEASGNINQIMEVIEMVKSKRPDFAVLSGDDNLTLPLIALGGDGVISVVSNLVPELIQTLYKQCAKGNFEAAKVLHYRLLPLFRGAFIETNPIPIKALMHFSELPSGPCRLPLCRLAPENEKHLRHLHETLKLPLLACG